MRIPYHDLADSSSEAVYERVQQIADAEGMTVVQLATKATERLRR